jgi:hypothetical protein
MSNRKQKQGQIKVVLFQGIERGRLLKIRKFNTFLSNPDIFSTYMRKYAAIPEKTTIPAPDSETRGGGRGAFPRVNIPGYFSKRRRKRGVPQDIISLIFNYFD